MQYILLVIVTILSSSYSYAAENKIYVQPRIECTLSLDGKNVPMISSRYKESYKNAKAQKHYRYLKNDLMLDVERSVEKNSIRYKFNVYAILEATHQAVKSFIGAGDATFSLNEIDTQAELPQGPLQWPGAEAPEPVSVTKQLGSLNGVLVEATCVFPGTVAY